MNLGYACINMTLSASKPKITTNRSMIKKTFNEEDAVMLHLKLVKGDRSQYEPDF